MHTKYILLLLISGVSSKDLLSSVTYGPAACALLVERDSCGSSLMYRIRPTEEAPHQPYGLMLVNREHRFISDKELESKLKNEPNNFYLRTLLVYIQAFDAQKGLRPRDNEFYERVLAMAPKRTAAFFEERKKESSAFIFPHDPEVDELLSFKPGRPVISVDKIKQPATQFALTRAQKNIP